jgi:hypothetical protein
MKMRFLMPLVVLFSALTATLWADARVRHIAIDKDQIAAIKTALGVATIIQVPDKPNSVVVGDMNAFKVEYLDTAITIKPLTVHARSNLYIYTDYRRFNVQLVTGGEASADYVVYLDNPAVKPKAVSKRLPSDGINWNRVTKFLSNDELSLKTTRIGMRLDGMMFVEFELRCKKSEAIKPEWFWLTQEGDTKPIQGLILSSLKITPKSPVRGTIEILKSVLNDDESLRIELRRKKTSYLTFPKVNEWKF